jgi:phenylacetyl-CoA:acceptor oxidoreductase 27-kDa subunit
MIRWGVVVDLEQCFGCNSCSAVCREVYGPDSNWRTVHDLGTFDILDGARISVPTSCMHCAQAPCVEVCPTTASFIREDGIVDIDYTKCIGCGYCILACPYDARVISSVGKITHTSGNSINPLAEITTKCTFCAEKIDNGINHGYRPGVDDDATPECVITCSAKALTFGDLNNPQSTVSLLLKTRRSVRINETLGTEPSLSYLLSPKMYEI